MPIKRLVLLFIVWAGQAAVGAATAVPVNNTTRPNSWGGQRVSPTEAGPEMACSEVQQMYVTKAIGEAQMVPTSAVSGKELSICSADSSCCTKEMEGKYILAVKRDFGNILHSTSTYRKSMVATQTQHLRDHLQALLRKSENETLHSLEKSHQRLYPEAQIPVAILFARLASAVHGEPEQDISSAVSTFFDELFPLVYRHAINPKLEDLKSDYKECLRLAQPQLRPFGDAPKHLTNRLTNALLGARVLLQSLTLSIDVLNTTARTPVGDSCQHGLVRLLYCPHCRALTTVRPCSGYCLNVVRGCLATVSELDTPWSDAVSGMERLCLSLQRNSHDPEEALALVHGRILEAIMHAMEQGPHLTQQLKKACGHTSRVERDVAPKSSSANSNVDSVASPAGSSPSSSSTHHNEHTSSSSSSDSSNSEQQFSEPSGRLRERLQNLMKSLSSIKGFYSSLSEALCNEDTLSERGEGKCWNGHSVSQYNKMIVGNGLSAQKYNPEMEIPQTHDEKIVHLMDRLKHMKPVLMSHAASIPESDALLNDGSGSGWRQGANHYNDDEDYDDDGDDWSGDGSGDGGHPHKNHWNNPGNQKPVKPNKRPSETDGLDFEAPDDRNTMGNEVGTEKDASRPGKKVNNEVRRPQNTGGADSVNLHFSMNFLMVAVSVWMSMRWIYI